MNWLAAVAMATSFALLFALVAVHVRYARLRRALEAGGLFEHEPETEAASGHDAVVLENGSRPLLDRLLRRSPSVFAALVVVLAGGTWAAGYALAPYKGRFLAAPEWRFQPVYLTAHLLTLRLFISVFTRNFLAGAARLDMAPEKIAKGFRIVLGPLGLLLAAAIAAPFCASDYGYLYGDDYNRMGDAHQVLPVDLLMWGIWCAEWLLNAVIWVVIVGFLVMNVWAIRTYRFRAPIEVVLNERHYRPFLQMSSQGAGIVLGFAIVTAIYILYTDGAMTDYLGLGIAVILLVFGFLPPWMLLNAKVDEAVRAETAALRRSLAGTPEMPAEAPGFARSIQEIDRLDQAVTMLRIQHLERLHDTVGRAEVRALTLRLVAPAAPAVWQLAHNFQDVLTRVWDVARGMLAPLMKLFT
jgi:hypothetical protein